MSFSPSSIPYGNNIRLIITITNPASSNLGTLTGINFTDNLPSGIYAYQTNGGGDTCGGATAQISSTQVSLSGATLGPKQSCTLSIGIGPATSSDIIGVHTNDLTVHSSDRADVTVSASITVTTPETPEVSVQFNPDSIPLQGTTQMMLRVRTANLNYISFTDTLPVGLVISTPKQVTTSCDFRSTGGPQVTAGGNTITVSQARLTYFTPECTIYVNVTGTVTGLITNQFTVKAVASEAVGSGTLTVTSASPPVQGTPANIPAQTVNLPGASSTGGPLICSCEDVPRLLDRAQKLTGIKTLITNKLQSTAANAPASQQDWAALQTQIRNYVQALQMQNLTQFPETSLFAGNGDPFCGTQMISAGACLDQDFAIHQQAHSASCRAGYWNWQTPWTDSSMMQEEASALQNEIDAIQAAVSRINCMQAGASAGNSGGGAGSSNQQSGGGAPAYCKEEDTPDGDTDAEFKLVVQNITTTSVNLPGALSEMSSRSMNNGRGIQIDIDVHEDGKFDGKGSGEDAGTVAGAALGETVSGQFGHSQDISASGEINPGTCEGQQCQGDEMHLVLEGAESQQTGQFQARGQVNRDINQDVSTGSAQIEFDFPAYVGSSAKKVFLATPMINSYMTVQIIPGKETPTLPVGTSLLYAEEQCKEAKKFRPGANKLTAAKSNSGAGIMIPGLTNNIPLPTNPPPVAIHVDETIHATDTSSPLTTNDHLHAGNIPTMLPPVEVTVNESISMTDGVPAGSNVIHQSGMVNETVNVSDNPQP